MGAVRAKPREWGMEAMVQFKPPPLCNRTLSLNSVNFSLDLKLNTDFIIYPIAQIERMTPCRCQVWFFALQNNTTRKVQWKIPHHVLNLGSDDTKALRGMIHTCFFAEQKESASQGIARLACIAAGEDAYCNLLQWLWRSATRSLHTCTHTDQNAYRVIADF